MNDHNFYVTPSHLGGHYNGQQLDMGIFAAIRDEFKVESVIDIGCGIGEFVTRLRDRWMKVMGVDGDENCARTHPNVIAHDYARGPLYLGEWDLAWSTEFLEHVNAPHVPKVMSTFKGCKYAFVSVAPPGSGGYHHVNEQSREYWARTFFMYGFEFDAEFTEYLLKERSVAIYDKFGASVRKTNVLVRGAMFFRRKEFCDPACIEAAKKFPQIPVW